MVKLLGLCDTAGRRRKGVHFHIQFKTVTSRWPNRTPAGTSFSMPTIG